jgi:hypothetical protein
MINFAYGRQNSSQWSLFSTLRHWYHNFFHENCFIHHQVYRELHVWLMTSTKFDERNFIHVEGRPVGDQTLMHSEQVESKRKALLFLVSKQNLNPSSLRIWNTNNCQKQIKNEKVITLKVKAIKNSKKQTNKHYKGKFPNTQANPPHMLAMRGQTWFVEIQVMLPYHLKSFKMNKK